MSEKISTCSNPTNPLATALATAFITPIMTTLLAALLALAAIAGATLTGVQTANAQEIVASSEDGTQTYTSVSSAWNAARSGTKIVMQSNWQLDSRLVVSSGKNVTIEMNGCIISRTHKDYETNGEVIEMESNSSLTLLGNNNPNKSADVRCVDFDRDSIDGESNYKYSWVTSGGFINGGLSANGAGGIHMHEGATLTLDNVAVVGNFTKSSVWTAAGGGIQMAGNNCKLVMKNKALIDSNYAYDYGGGVYVNGDSCSISMSGGSHINGNRADKQGGGVYVNSDNCTLNMSDDCYINGNRADTTGGGIYLNQEKATISGGVISENTADKGAGIYNNDSYNTISDCTIINNTANTAGGGIYCDSLKDISLTGVVYVLDNKRASSSDGNLDDDLYLQTGAASQAYLASAPSSKSAIGIRVEIGNVPSNGIQVATNQTTFTEGMFFSNLPSLYIQHRYSDKCMFLRWGATEKSYYVVINGEKYGSWKQGDTVATNGQKEGEWFWKWVSATGISLTDLKNQKSSLTTFKMPANSVFLTAGYVTPVDKLTLNVDTPKGGESLAKTATLSWTDDDNVVQEKEIDITWYEVTASGDVAASEKANNNCSYYFKADIQETTKQYLKLSTSLNKESVTIKFSGDSEESSTSSTAKAASLSNGVLSVESNSVKSEYGTIIASDVALNTDKPEGGVQLPTKATLSWTANGVAKTADVFLHWYVNINGEENLASLGKADYNTTYTPEICIYASQQKDLDFNYNATAENVILTYGDSEENQIQTVNVNSVGNIVLKGKPITTSKPKVTRVTGGSITVQSGTSLAELKDTLPANVVAYVESLTGEKATSLPIAKDSGNYSAIVDEYGAVTSSGTVYIPLNITADSDVALPDSQDSNYTYALQVNVTEKQDLPQAEAPKLDVDSGTFKQTSLTVHATCGTENAVIKYKLDDGSEQAYNPETGIVLSGQENAQVTHTITVWAEAEGFSKSNELIASYLLDDLQSDSGDDSGDDSKEPTDPDSGDGDDSQDDQGKSSDEAGGEGGPDDNNSSSIAKTGDTDTTLLVAFMTTFFSAAAIAAVTTIAHRKRKC